MKTFFTSAVAFIVAVIALVMAHGAGVAPAVSLGGSGAIDSVNYHCWAGVCNYHGSATLKTATTTPCAIQGPAATSTVSSAALRLDTGSTTATTWTIGIATNAFATTTPLGTDYVLAANKQGFDVASSTGVGMTVAPNGWVVFSETGGITAADAGTGFVPTGACRATFTTALL